MKYFLVLWVSLSWIGLSCTKISIKGYTATDSLGNIMGVTDASDWTFDPYWMKKESDVFSSIDSGDLSGTSAGSISIYPASPNPCSASFLVHFQSSTKCKARIAIVNNKLDKLLGGALSLEAGNNVFSFSVSASGFKAGNLYRMYYVFDAQGSLQFKKGHGDIFVQ